MRRGGKAAILQDYAEREFAEERREFAGIFVKQMLHGGHDDAPNLLTTSLLTMPFASWQLPSERL